MKITRAVVPSLFTVLNMFCGFFSIVHSSDGRFEVAAWLIVLAGVFDSLDGAMARLTKSTSQFGVEIDSLSDVVSFGAAPAFLVFKLHLYQLEGIGLLISSLLLIMGGIRLARFNVQLVGFDKEHFTGLPIPASAITIVSFVLTFKGEGAGLAGTPAVILPVLVTVVSLLMVSKVKYDTLPKPSVRAIRRRPVWSISVVAGALIVLFTRGKGMFYVFVAFILFGVLRWIVQWWRKKPARGDSKAEEEVEEAASYDI